MLLYAIADFRYADVIFLLRHAMLSLSMLFDTDAFHTRR